MERTTDIDYTKLAGVYVGVHRSEGWFGTLIASASAPGYPWQRGRNLAQIPSHIRIGVYDVHGRMVYFEAREFDRLDWSGPYPEEKAQAWLAANPKRWCKIYRLDAFCGPIEANEVLRRCLDRLPYWRYGTYQNWRLLAEKWLRWAVPLSDNDVNCSEAARRILEGVPQLGWHPVLPRGIWAPVPPDKETPYLFEQDLIRLGLTPEPVRVAYRLAMPATLNIAEI